MSDCPWACPWAWAADQCNADFSDEQMQSCHAGDQDDRKKVLVDQLKQLDANYPGGLKKYITNAKKLLEESKSGMPTLPCATAVPRAANSMHACIYVCC